MTHSCEQSPTCLAVSANQLQSFAAGRLVRRYTVVSPCYCAATPLKLTV
jgi:hypothetical protein